MRTRTILVLLFAAVAVGWGIGRAILGNPSTVDRYAVIDGDTFAPELGDDWTFDIAAPAEGWLAAKNGTQYRFTTWRRTEN